MDKLFLAVNSGAVTNAPHGIPSYQEAEDYKDYYSQGLLVRCHFFSVVPIDIPKKKIIHPQSISTNVIPVSSRSGCSNQA